MSDILSVFVSNRATVSLIKKIYRLTSIILLLSILYSAFDLLQLFVFFNNAPSSLKNIHNYFFRYKVSPVISIIQISLNVIAHLYNYNAYINMVDAIDNLNDDSMEKAFSKFYTSAVLIAIILAMLVITVIYRSFSGI